MMTVPMNESPAPEPRELAQRLFRKNIDLENGLRRAAQSRVPSDPNTWVQMRENYETIILEDHDFSEKHEVEYALWQLHYRRIEEFRAHINRCASAGGSVAPQGGKNVVRPDRVKKIRSVFKSFLSEATGFYHDLMLKIRSKYGLPLAYVSEASEAQIILVKDDKKSAELKKGMLSCHRCLIYLGDLARYKGLYGEGDSSRDFAAASSYYVQAASLWPSSGNPHHQLAILASYSGEELMTIYRYFRSLAVESPFSTARDNLILAFEKNRQSYSQLLVNVKVPPSKSLPPRTSGRGRGRGDTKLLAKDSKMESAKEQEPSMPEIFKAFSIRFIRLSGILFTRTSLETFGEVLSLVIGNLHDLVSSGPEEELNFGSDATENGLVILRLVTILVFSVHNVSRETEGQSYAEILQRTVLLQNALSAAFEFVGHLLKRCVELRDVASSYLLPGILVFMEWLACHQDFATRIDVDGIEAARSFFWNQCISFMNKLMLSELAGIDDDEDIACFSDMSLYDEGETGNRLALWEDFELRGFSPLVPAHLILDFSRRNSLGNDLSNKEKQVRIKRILAAGKALVQVVRINQQGVYYDSNLKKIVIGMKPPSYDHFVAAHVDASEPNYINKTIPTSEMDKVQSKLNTKVAQIESKVFMEGEEDDEVIVFQPTVIEKYPNYSISKSSVAESIPPEQNFSESEAYVKSHIIHDLKLPSGLKATSQLPVPVPSVSPLTDNGNMLSLKWAVDQNSYFTNGLENSNITECMPSANPVMQGQFSVMQPTSSSNCLQHIRSSPFFSTTASVIPSGLVSYQNNMAEAVIPSKLDSVVPDDMAQKFSAPLLSTARKNPVSRPVKHIGPPPGFVNAPVKRLDDTVSKSVAVLQPQMDDYSWLDGCQMSSAEGISTKNTFSQSANTYPHVSTSSSNAFKSAMAFPFPGKQIPMVQSDLTKRQNFHLPEHMKSFSEPQIPRSYQQSSPQPEEYQAQSLWSSHFFV